MLFWLIVGVALGYFFKPQLDDLVSKALRAIDDNRRRNNGSDY